MAFFRKKDKKQSVWYMITHTGELDKEEYMKLVKGATWFVGLGFAASFAVFIIIAFIGGIGTVVRTILDSNLYIYLLAFLAVFLGILLRFGKWQYYLKTLELKVPLKKNLIVYLSLYSMNITPGMLGRVLVAYTISRLTDVKISSVVPIVTMDIFTDFMGTAVVAILAAIYFHQYVLYVLGLDILLIIPYAFILNDWFYRVIKRIFRNRRFLEMFTLYGDEYFASQSALNTPKTYAVSMAATIPATVLSAMALYFTLLATGIVPHVAGTIFIYTSAHIFGMATAIPGNIGVTDGALVALLGSTFHLSTGVASAVTIMTRFATLWFGISLGGVLLIYTFRYWGPSKRAAGMDEKGKRKRKTA
jgi:uncharacterized membrane protein YbhN (UPF0104 family)